MNQHGLREQLWSFQFDRSVSRLGLCSHRKKTISLGTHATLVNDELAVRNTILHEIAHALVGVNHNHDAVWKAKAREIGCTGERLGNIAIKASPKYRLKCLDCQVSWAYYRKPKRWLHPNAVHKCPALLQRIGYTSDKPWMPVPSNLQLEVK
jgi:predicted SprT family Zn-dependent metalloprotease